MEIFVIMKSRFYTNISHELKTPVTLIISPLKNMIAKLGEKGFLQVYEVQVSQS